MLVVDAGAAARFLLQLPMSDQIWTTFEAHGHVLHAPELFDVEVLSVLRKLLLRRDLLPARADEAVTDLRALRLVRHRHDALLSRTWDLRANITPYDGLYVALTETLGEQAALLTTDARLARAVRQQSTARVVLVA